MVLPRTFRAWGRSLSASDISSFNKGARKLSIYLLLFVDILISTHNVPGVPFDVGDVEMKNTQFWLQETQHNRESERKIIKWLYNVISLQGVEVTQRGRKNSFHLALLEKATSRGAITVELAFRGWIEVCHVEKVEKEGISGRELA